MSAATAHAAEPIGALETRISCRNTAAHALTIVRDGVITGEGPTTRGRIHFSRELDADDAHAFHALAILDGVAIGCGRMLEHGGSEVKIGRMAVLPEFRKTGVGAHILRFLTESARTRGFRKAILHAQLTAEGFYLNEGFSPVGGVFDEAGIAHRKMEREL